MIFIIFLKVLPSFASCRRLVLRPSLLLGLGLSSHSFSPPLTVPCPPLPLLPQLLSSLPPLPPLTPLPPLVDVEASAVGEESVTVAIAEVESITITVEESVAVVDSIVVEEPVSVEGSIAGTQSTLVKVTSSSLATTEWLERSLDMEELVTATVSTKVKVPDADPRTYSTLLLI
ncbi:hypothetical protein MMC14_002559 [Varicellaria rhodocarpa]|nr:hypothetical protein [Varicellaria rhodocarpa]